MWTFTYLKAHPGKQLPAGEWLVTKVIHMYTYIYVYDGTYIYNTPTNTYLKAPPSKILPAGEWLITKVKRLHICKRGLHLHKRGLYIIISTNRPIHI